VRVNLKRPNHKYPSCHLVGRYLTFPVTTTFYIPWVEFVFPSLRFGQLNWLTAVTVTCQANTATDLTISVCI